MNENDGNDDSDSDVKDDSRRLAKSTALDKISLLDQHDPGPVSVVEINSGPVVDPNSPNPTTTNIENELSELRTQMSQSLNSQMPDSSTKQMLNNPQMWSNNRPYL